REDLATALVASGEYGQGESELVRLIAKQPEGAEPRRDLLHLRGLCLIALARPLDARQVYRTLTEHEAGNNDLDAWVGLGRSAFLVGDMRSLRRAGERARAIDPSRPDGAVLLALHARESADAEQALAALDQFEGPGTADLHTLRALILADLGRHGDARDAIYAALDHTPGDASAMRLLDRLPEPALETFATAPTE
ncbi:MAG: tetratricopeptide repeat protein, partial [Planctomycetota bacterium]